MSHCFCYIRTGTCRSTKMNLAGCSGAELARSKNALDAFLGDATLLHRVRELKTQSDITSEQEAVLACFEKTLLCYIVEDPSAVELKATINTLESELAAARNHMPLHYTNDQGKVVKASSVLLSTLMRTSDNEDVRLSCWEGMLSIGPFVAEKFCEIVKLRNQLAKKLGYVDFYDMKVTQAEGFSKDVLFSILDGLEVETRPILQEALVTLKASKGVQAVAPHNINYLLSGDMAKRKDPYFPFEDAVDVWARSFAAMDISYRGATMRLDLCDRPGKYSNGFCHWPQPAWHTQTGEWVPSQTNFTSLASPTAVGSGATALVTLMHEGGHGRTRTGIFIVLYFCHVFSSITRKSPLTTVGLCCPSCSCTFCECHAGQPLVLAGARAHQCCLCGEPVHGEEAHDLT